MKHPHLALALALTFLPACKNETNAPAGGADARVSATMSLDAELGLNLPLPATWVSRTPAVKGRLLEARRTAPPAKPFKVAPKLVVSRAETHRTLDEDVQQTITELKKLDDRPKVSVKRTLTGVRTFSGVEFREVEVNFTVEGATPEQSREIVQRTFLTHRATPSGKSILLDVTASYLAEDEEVLGTDIDNVLSGLEFEGIKVRAPAPKENPTHP